MIYAPPGSGYFRPEDEESTLPATYDPMMEYPGTMRPGRTPENMPFSDLPIADTDPDPVPWPHFQQIEWHHKWDPPHDAPIEMDQFIEMEGRWATPEMEAAMRAGVRQGVRERQEKEAEERRDAWVITDDDEDDDDTPSTENVELGDGMFGSIGSAVVDAMTAEVTRPKAEGEETEEEEEEDDEDASMEDDLDSFLLDLGLDADVDMDDSDISAKAPPQDVDDGDESSTLDLLSDDGEVTATINVDADDDLDLGLDEDDDLGDDGVSEVPLDDFGDDNDTLQGEDIFDEGGFDYDDGDFDAGDVW